MMRTAVAIVVLLFTPTADGAGAGGKTPLHLEKKQWYSGDFGNVTVGPGTQQMCAGYRSRMVSANPSELWRKMIAELGLTKPDVLRRRAANLDEPDTGPIVEPAPPVVGADPSPSDLRKVREWLAELAALADVPMSDEKKMALLSGAPSAFFGSSPQLGKYMYSGPVLLKDPKRIVWARIMLYPLITSGVRVVWISCGDVDEQWRARIDPDASNSAAGRNGDPADLQLKAALEAVLGLKSNERRKK